MTQYFNKLPSPQELDYRCPKAGRENALSTVTFMSCLFFTCLGWPA